METMFILGLELCRCADNTKVTKEISFTSMPNSFQEVSQQIEDNYSIPQCVQRIDLCHLNYCHQVGESDTLASLYIRSGDLLRITYPFEGQCKQVKLFGRLIFNMVQEVTKLYDVAHNGCTTKRESLDTQCINYLLDKDPMEVIEFLFADFCHTDYVNKIFFSALGGLDLIIQLYDLIVKLRKESITFQEENILERMCIYTFIEFMNSGNLFLYSSNQKCLELLLDSFLKESAQYDVTYFHMCTMRVLVFVICT